MSAQYKKSFEVRINKCDRTKAMYNMEYSTFILNLIFSFVCGLLTFLHLLDVKKDFINTFEVSEEVTEKAKQKPNLFMRFIRSLLRLIAPLL